MTKKTLGNDALHYEVITQEDPDSGDVIIPLPLPVLEKLGWKEGDEIQFAVDNGKIYLRKK